MIHIWHRRKAIQIWMYTMKATCVQKKEKLLQNRKPERPTEKWQKLGIYLLEQTHLLANGTYLPGDGYRNMQDVKIKHNSDQSKHLKLRLALSKLGADGPYITSLPPSHTHLIHYLLYVFLLTHSVLCWKAAGKGHWNGWVLFYSQSQKEKAGGGAKPYFQVKSDSRSHLHSTWVVLNLRAHWVMEYDLVMWERPTSMPDVLSTPIRTQRREAYNQETLDFT